MENNVELIAQCEKKAKQWLAPAFDAETRREVQSSGRVACAVLWGRVPTE